ncbi:MAG TPA: DUF3108 domain-containing protein [Vicinamibacterales bacterium]|nr:DUF3108 domain-containing protein [Vicinamibacterales bacterium]
MRPLVVYIVAAVVVTFPLVVSLTTKLGALQGPGDPYLNLWILGWGLRAWTADPLSVFDGRVFDANIFFPAEGTLAYSDHFLLQSLALAPVYALTGNVVLCYNLLLIASIVLSGLAMHLLTRGVTGSERGAYLAGLAWACWPYRTAHLLHIQLQALYFMPLAVLCLHRVMAGRRWRDALALAAATTLQFVASVYYGLMTGIVLVVAGVTLALATGQWRASRLWSRLAVAAGLTIALSVPVMVPYARSQQAEGFGRTPVEAARHSASVQAYTQVPPDNLLYGRSGLLAPRAPRLGEPDRTHVEHHLFPGFALIGLAVFGLSRHARSDARPLALSALALVGVGLVLSFGPEGFRGLYVTLHDNVFGFQAIRSPARFSVIAVLGLSLLAALGIRAVKASAVKAPAWAGAFLIALLCLEYLNAPLPLAAAPPQRTEVGQWLATEPTAGAVLHLPIAVDIENTPFMVQSLEHGRPIVNGYSGQRPSYYAALVESLGDFPSPDAFTALRELDVRFVVSPAAVAGAGSPLSPLVERARFNDGAIYEVRWTPESLAALDDADPPPPPPPGRPPFAAGESLAYDVYWDAGPLDLPAGTATLSVVEGREGADRWVFETRAETADWVSTFFEARDRFVTVANAELLPVEHRREIREGRREVDRRYVYDRDAGIVQTGQMALPLGDAAARDALSALYYVRTLPLQPGSIVSVPMNEAGTRLMLQVQVGEVENIEREDRLVPALRLEPRVMRRIERRRPLVITLWMTPDERRVPLRAIVDAGFGVIRLELRNWPG